MSKVLSRSIAISNCSEPLQHGVNILCPASARLALKIASEGHTSLRVPIKPTVQVPKGYVGATVSERKPCKKVGGLAGRRKKRVLEERQDDEKVIQSKALLLAETPPPAAEAGPSLRDKAAAFIVPEAVLQTDDDDDDDFQVTISFGLWCHATESSCGLYRTSEPSTSNHGRGKAVANSS